VSRLKIMAELDIAERRVPQDGRIRLRMRDRQIDVRVSTLPTLHGESVVLRLLDKDAAASPARARHDADTERASSTSSHGRTASCSPPARPAPARRPRSTPPSTASAPAARRS
jgi:hypothetical protein